MKSHLQLADDTEESITFKSISYKITDKHLVVKLDSKSYRINIKKIHQQQFGVRELCIFLDYLIVKSKEYISITSPVDCVIKLEEW